MDRRTYLRIAFVPSFGAMCGCTSSWNDSDHNASDTDGSSDPSSNDSSPSNPGDRQDSSQSERVDPIYVDNLRNHDIDITVTVRRSSDDQIILDNKYSVPNGHGAVIHDVGRFGMRYEILASINGNTEQKYWEPSSCRRSSEYESSGGEHTPAVVSVVPESDYRYPVTIEKVDCDVVAQVQELTYQNHSEYIKED